MRYLLQVRDGKLAHAEVRSIAHPGAFGLQGERPIAAALPRRADQSAERVEALDALRGMMALNVALYHLGVWTHAFSGAVRSAVILLGIYSVEGFFIISGFCFFHLYRHTTLRGAALWSFHRKRFLRIAPLYYAALALTLTFDPAYRALFTWPRLIGNVTLTFGLFHPNHALVPGGWSIGLEYVFYLVLPGLLWLCRRQRLALHALVLLTVAWSLLYTFDKVETADDRFHVYVQLPNHAFAFVLGALIADLRGRTEWRLPFVGMLGALVVLAGLAALDLPQLRDHFEAIVGTTRVRYASLCFMAVLLFAFARLPRAVLAGPLRWLGGVSYALYLMHPIAWLLLMRLAPPIASPMSRAACGLLAALVLAEIARRCIEQPVMRFARRVG